jgi:hypothetical protein
VLSETQIYKERFRAPDKENEDKETKKTKTKRACIALNFYFTFCMRLIINSAKLISINGAIKVNIPTDIEIRRFSIVSASIPFSFYNINSNANQFQLNGTTYTLAKKNYNAYQLRDAINSLISTSGIAVSFDKQTLHFSFTRSTLAFTFNALSLGVILGFNSSTTYTSTFVNGKYTIESVNAVDLVMRNIYVKSNLAPNNIYENSVQTNSILYRIPINVSFGNIIYFQNTSDINLNNEATSKFSTLEFTLTDSNQNLLDLNNAAYQLEFFLDLEDEDAFSQRYTLYNAPKPVQTIHPYELLSTR